MKVLKAVLIGIIVIAVIGVGAFYFLARSSQNGSAPGLVDGGLAPCPDSPNCVSSEAGVSNEKAVAVLTADAWDRIPAAVKEMGGTVTRQDDGYIAAEFKSNLFGFVDDTEFRKAEEGVHVRSASRVGYSDGGVNAKRVDELRAKLGN